MSNRKVFSFKKQLGLGNKGELSFIKKYKQLSPRKCKIHQFDILINDNERLEIKTDSYKESDTKNFFIEKIGVSTRSTLGGPWLSKLNNCKYFVYHYINNKSFYWFNPNDLCKFIDKNKNKLQIRRIWNRGYDSIGYLVPRNMVEHLLIRKDIF